jgi:hypothetical protein
VSLHTLTVEEKLRAVEEMIRESLVMGAGERASVLKAIAADLRARLDLAPTVALVEIERRVNAVARSRGSITGSYDPAKLHLLGEGVAARWPVIKQALELLGARVEEGP